MFAIHFQILKVCEIVHSIYLLIEVLFYCGICLCQNLIFKVNLDPFRIIEYTSLFPFSGN
jgi:hypothetical protein